MAFLIAAAVIIFDIITKLLAKKYLIDGTFPIIEDVLHFTYVENRGAAFGILKDHRWVFMIISVFAIALIIFFVFYFKPRSLTAKIALGLVLGGGVGNMIDRIALGYVIDFIDFRLINFAVFNIADSAITVGAILLGIYLIFIEPKEAKDKKNA